MCPRCRDKKFSGGASSPCRRIHQRSSSRGGPRQHLPAVSSSHPSTSHRLRILNFRCRWSARKPPKAVHGNVHPRRALHTRDAHTQTFDISPRIKTRVSRQRKNEISERNFYRAFRLPRYLPPARIRRGRIDADVFLLGVSNANRYSDHFYEFLNTLPLKKLYAQLSFYFV